ncbi:MAG: cytochrome c biogenesis protein CcdA [Peptococcaceae bacterium]|nr:cytochrome c biogenesis protein CcdA [Peptococcaceae bacterium]
MENVSFAMAFVAGLLSFLSPCILPLIPAYLSFLTGSAASALTTQEAKTNLMPKAIGFVLGFSLIFIIMGASASKLGQLFTEYKPVLTKVGGLVIILLGIHLTGLLKIKFLYREKRLISFSEKNRGLGSVFIGMAFATGWTPCIGPILAAILIYAGSMETVSSGVLLLSFYSLGLALPFLLTALAIHKFSLYFRRFAKYLNHVAIGSGLLLILTGILIFTDKLTILASF